MTETKKAPAKRKPAAKKPAVAKAAPKKRGRPKGSVTYKPETHIPKILAWISDGKTLRDYCRQTGCPSYVTVYDWLESNEEFSKRFARARDIGHDVIAQECLEIANTPVEGKRVKKTEDGMEVVIEDALGHRKLQIETRLKLLAKWNPKKYGEKITHSGDAENPVSVIIRGDDANL
jgi:hypothetical protein